VPPEEADVLLVSVPFIGTISRLRSIRKRFPNKYIVAGGMTTFYPGPLLAWADAVVVGEGYKFFQAVMNGADPREMEDQPYIYTKTKDPQEVVPETEILWEMNPLVDWTNLSGSHNWQYMVSRGCKKRCKFCGPGNYTTYEEVPYPYLKAVRKQVGDTYFSPVANDTTVEVLRMGFKLCNASTTVMEYVKYTEAFKGIGMIRLGVEGFDEESRRAFGKPISDEDLFSVFELSKKYKQGLVLFFIWRGEQDLDPMMKFFDRIPKHKEQGPVVKVKLTPLELHPGTPCGEWQLPMKDAPVAHWLYQQNRERRRLGFMAIGQVVLANYNSIFRRANPEDAAKFPVQSFYNRKTTEEMFEDLRARGVGHLIDQPDTWAPTFKCCRRAR